MTVRPYVTHEGDHPHAIAATNGCTVEEIQRARPNDAEEQRPDALVPGEVVLVPDRPHREQQIRVAQPNDYAAKVPDFTVEIKLVDALGRPAPAGTRFRLSIGASPPIEGTTSTPGLVGSFKVGASKPLILEWGAHPQIEYALTPPSSSSAPSEDPLKALSPSRAEILFPVSVPELRDEVTRDVDPRRDSTAKCLDRRASDAAASTIPSHKHHFIAKKVADLISSNGGNTWGPTRDSGKEWDKRWFAAHPLAPRILPVPLRVAASDDVAYFQKQTLTIAPIAGDSTRGTAVAREAPAWYNGQKDGVQLFGIPKAVRSNRPANPPGSRGRNEDWLELVTAYNKRLVKLWMGDVRTAVPAAEHSWLTDWFATPDAQHHFKNWCQILVIADQDGGEGHKNGCALDVDYTFNPWAPLFSEESKQMLGEPKKNSLAGDLSATGRAYDRALRLFLGSTHPDPATRALELARGYYKNNWSWTPDQVHEIYCGYQALNWSLIAYFDYGFRRAATPKITLGKGDNRPCQFVSEQKPDAVWQAFSTDAREKRFHPDAELILDVAPVGAEELFVKRALRYPFGAPLSVWTSKVHPLVERSSGKETALGGCLLRQLKADHLSISRVTERDACRGIFNMGYEVALAFGRMLSDSRDLSRMRMFSFGMGTNANGGDFMHIEYNEGDRALERLDVRVDGVRVDSSSSWNAQVGSSASLTVQRSEANGGKTEDVTNAAELDVVTSDIDVCDLQRDGTLHKLLARARGRCLVTVSFRKVVAALSVVVS